MEANFNNLKHQIECLVTELINNGKVNFNETIGIYSISGKVVEHPNMSIILGNDGDISIAFSNIAHSEELKHVYAAEKQHILEEELKKNIQELKKQVEKAKNAAD